MRLRFAVSGHAPKQAEAKEQGEQKNAIESETNDPLETTNHESKSKIEAAATGS